MAPFPRLLFFIVYTTLPMNLIATHDLVKVFSPQSYEIQLPISCLPWPSKPCTAAMVIQRVTDPVTSRCLSLQSVGFPLLLVVSPSVASHEIPLPPVAPWPMAPLGPLTDSIASRCIPLLAIGSWTTIAFKPYRFRSLLCGLRAPLIAFRI